MRMQPVVQPNFRRHGAKGSSGSCSHVVHQLVVSLFRYATLRCTVIVISPHIVHNVPQNMQTLDVDPTLSDLLKRLAKRTLRAKGVSGEGSNNLFVFSLMWGGMTIPWLEYKTGEMPRNASFVS